MSWLFILGAEKKKKKKTATVNPVPESKEPRWEQPAGGER